MMMLAPLLISLSLASFAVCLNINAKEEIVKVAAASIALICLILSLFFAPLVIKLSMLAIPLLGEKLNLFKFFDQT